MTDPIEQLDKAIQDAKVNIELGSALVRLQSNPDFKKVIQEGYFKEEAVRLVHLKAEPAMQSPNYQAGILAQIDAIGTLAMYFQTVQHLASMAGRTVEEAETMRADILEGNE